MKKFMVIGTASISSLMFSQVGINTQKPTETLDVNGTTRVRSLGVLASSNVSAIYADENGVLGKANISPQSQIAFYTANSTMSYTASSYNAGTDQVVQIESFHAGLNAVGTTVPATGNIRISQSGIYMLSGSITPQLTMNNDGDGYAYMAVNLDISTDGGTLWTSVSGGRPMFPRVTTVSRNYSFTIPSVIRQLNAGDLVRIKFFRTKYVNGTLQGSSMSAVTLGSDYGAPTYTLSVTKL